MYKFYIDELWMSLGNLVEVNLNWCFKLGLLFGETKVFLESFKLIYLICDYGVVPGGGLNMLL